MTNELNYSAWKPCGCMAFVMAPPFDTNEKRKDLAKELSYAARRGYDIERLTTEEVRTRPWVCDSHQPKKQGALL